MAEAAQQIHDETPSLGQGPQTSLLTVVNDLKAAVETNPAEVTVEILRTTQTIVSSKSSSDFPILSLCPHYSTKYWKYTGLCLQQT
jgi:hypothetical protein